MSGKRKSPTPDWLFGRSSKFKGIWIPREIPPTGIGPFPNTAWPTPFAHENDWKLVRDLFKAHELDSTDPIHWQKLILIFANEHRSRQPGAKKLWTEADCANWRPSLSLPKLQTQPGRIQIFASCSPPANSSRLRAIRSFRSSPSHSQIWTGTESGAYCLRPASTSLN